MQKWEYCEVDARYGDIAGIITVVFHKPTGADTQKYELRKRTGMFRQTIEDTDEKAREIVAQLGLEGWELVNVEGGRMFRLKRPLSNS